MLDLPVDLELCGPSRPTDLLAPEVDLSEDAEFHEGPDDFGGYGGAPGDDGDHSDHGDDGGHGGHGDDRDDRDDRDDLTSGFGQRAAEAAAV